MVLSVGLFRSPSVPSVVPVLMIASLVVNLAGQELVSRFLFLAGLGWLGLLVVTRREGVWFPMTG